MGRQATAARLQRLEAGRGSEPARLRLSRVTVTYSDEEFLRIFASLVYAGHGDGALHAYFGDDEAGDLAVVDLPCYGVGALTPVHGLEEQEGGLELPRLVGQFHPRNGFL